MDKGTILPTVSTGNKTSNTVVGRNSPCPCGSGKKYKKCCLPLKDAHDAQERTARHLEWLEWFKKDIEEGQIGLEPLYSSCKELCGEEAGNEDCDELDNATTENINNKKEILK